MANDKDGPKKPKEDSVRDAVILFADIIGSVEIANENTVERYDQIVSQFHQCARTEDRQECAEAILIGSGLREPEDYELSTKGDEVCLFLHPSADGANLIPRPEELAIAFVVALKLNWLVTPYNRERVGNNLLPRDCAIGLHRGKVTFQKRPGDQKARSEGFAISLAKRVEGEARRGRCTRCFVTREFEWACMKSRLQVSFARAAHRSVKGVSSSLALKELRDFSLAEFAILAKPGLCNGVTSLNSQAWLDVAEAAFAHSEDVWLMKLVLVVPFATDAPASLVERMRAAILLCPDYWEPHYKLGWACRLSGEYKEAMTEMEEAERLNEWDPEIRLELARVYAKLDRRADALSKLAEAEHLESNFAYRRYYRGVWHNDIGEHEEAIQCFSELIHMNARDAQAYMWRAVSRYKSGDSAGAEDDRGVALNLNPRLTEWPWPPP